MKHYIFNDELNKINIDCRISLHNIFVLKFVNMARNQLENANPLGIKTNQS